MDDVRVQRLVTLLTEYNDVVVHAGPIQQNAIIFWLNGKRIVHPINTRGDTESHLRTILHELGARPKLPAKPNTEIETASGEASTMTSENPNAEPEVVVPEEIFVDPPSVPEAHPADRVNEAPPAGRMNEPAGRVTNDKGIATVYRSSRVLAIEIEQDLIIPKGHMLVIPLNRPNALIDMQKDQFKALFETETAEVVAEAMPDSEPLPEPASIQPAPAAPRPAAPRQTPKVVNTPPKVANKDNFENDILAYLRQRKGAVKARVIANALQRPIYRTETHLRALLGRGIVECPQTGFWAIVKTTATSPPVSPAHRANPAFVDKVPPQLTRILAAMAFATKATGHPDLTSRDVTPHLPERDARHMAPGCQRHAIRVLWNAVCRCPIRGGVTFASPRWASLRYENGGRPPTKTRDCLSPNGWCICRTSVRI